MCGSCTIVNISWLLFATLVIVWKLCFNTKIHSLKVEFKYIFLRKLPVCRFMHSLHKNENISMWGKRIAPQQKKLLPFLPGSLFKGHVGNGDISLLFLRDKGPQVSQVLCDLGFYWPVYSHTKLIWNSLQYNFLTMCHNVQNLVQYRVMQWVLWLEIKL